MFKRLLLISSFFFASSSFAADYLDSQYGSDGLEVHVKKISINHNIITVVLEFENTSDEEVKYLALPITQVFYNTKDKKYPVLKDVKDKWLASPVAYSYSDYNIFVNRRESTNTHTFTLGAGKKKIGWAKFEAPQEADWPLDLSLPGVSPFSIGKPE